MALPRWKNRKCSDAHPRMDAARLDEIAEDMLTIDEYVIEQLPASVRYDRFDIVASALVLRINRLGRPSVEEVKELILKVDRGEFRLDGLLFSVRWSGANTRRRGRRMETFSRLRYLAECLAVAEREDREGKCSESARQTARELIAREMAADQGASS
ncbi:hypothetical protein [Phaeospirillum tilakii]|uniref:Uncharacterized protein n=1 Tax=Phaeospirillum tilakii TaxID=741673 RepID=A0ABW5C8I8_9PROT